jgi:gliding motility-associated-like protein
VEVELDIFNRWGELLHSQRNLEPMKKGWDGTKDGELLKKDTYTYRVRARDIFGEWYEYHGRLHLIR